MAGDEALQRLLDALDYPMCVVTTATDEERAGCLVGFLTQCSIRPPRFLVCISKTNRTDAGDHVAFLMAAVDTVGGPLRPLTFQRVRALEPGHRV